MKSGIYRHYKGGFYQLIGEAEHTETGQRLVVYVALAILPGPRIRCRPLDGPEGWNTPPVGHEARFSWCGPEIWAA